VGIYEGGDSYTLYCSPREDINEWLKQRIEEGENA